MTRTEDVKMERILVVEDHRPLQGAIRRILEKEGYTVLTASDGDEALNVLEEHYCDLILADIMMPGMDGYAFYEAVRARPEWTAIPFIFLTAKADKEDVLRGKGMGAEDYITKPFDSQELAVAIQARLQRARAIHKASGAELEQLKRQIVTLLGHELRTPLTYVVGYTDLALEALPATPNAMETFLLGIKKGAARLEQLVEDLVLLVWLDSGRAKTEFEEMARVCHDLNAIVEQTVAQHAARAEAQNVTIEVDTSETLPPVQLCDGFFTNALGRLISNAIKFSPPQGKRVGVSTTTARDWVTVAVRDEGIGIAAKEIPHLFERFRQIDRDKMEQQGVGLGLSIARDLIRLHGGEIAVESHPGRGSTFTIRLPVCR